MKQKNNKREIWGNRILWFFLGFFSFMIFFNNFGEYDRGYEDAEKYLIEDFNKEIETFEKDIINSYEEYRKELLQEYGYLGSYEITLTNTTKIDFYCDVRFMNDVGSISSWTDINFYNETPFYCDNNYMTYLNYN